MAGQQSPLDRYVAEGLDRSLRLKGSGLAVAKADAAVREARGRWLPSLALNARYSELSGDILDLGDLVNPAYRGLNQIMGRNVYPTDISFTQPFKQETRLRLTQPLFLPAASAGIAVAKSLRAGERAADRAERRRLAAEIRLAYLDLARASRVVELHQTTLELLRENLRVNQSLVTNGSATPDAVLRARADVSEGEQRLAEALRDRLAAREAFNLLLERPLDGAVELAADSAFGIELTVPLDSALAHGLAAREEPTQLDAGARAAQGQVRLATAAFLPTVVLAVDYGFQGERYRFTSDRDVLVASVVLQWNLFNGGQDQARRDQARSDAERYRTEQELALRRIELEIRTAWQAAKTAADARSTAADRLASAEQNYRLVERRYREGAAPQVALIDARTAYTAARLNRILVTYDYFARTVELDRAAALYPATGSTSAGDQS
jgi:outer membrane protein